MYLVNNIWEDGMVRCYRKNWIKERATEVQTLPCWVSWSKGWWSHILLSWHWLDLIYTVPHWLVDWLYLHLSLAHNMYSPPFNWSLNIVYRHACDGCKPVLSVRTVVQENILDIAPLNWTASCFLIHRLLLEEQSNHVFRCTNIYSKICQIQLWWYCRVS